MLKLISREKSFVKGYKEYCQEFYDNNILTFRPTNPRNIDENWFERTAEWYAKKRKELLTGMLKASIIGLLTTINLLENFNCVPI